MERKTKKVVVAGKELLFETGRIARQANGSCLVRCGDTMVFTSACAAPGKEETDFLGLRVDYQENFSSVGKTSSGFIKRQGRPSEREVLTSRLIDRPLRPLFPAGYFDEVQVLSYVWSYDGVHAPEPLAICAASAALALSDIPITKTLAAVRVGLVKGNLVINPSAEEQKESRLDLILAGTTDAILMIEGYSDFLSEQQVLDAIEAGHEAIKIICHAINEWQREIGKEKRVYQPAADTHVLEEAVAKAAQAKLQTALRIFSKQEREIALEEIKGGVIAQLRSEGASHVWEEKEIAQAFKKLTSHLMRQMIVEEGIRSDGRTTTCIRPIFIENGLLPRSHGSALFTRGETQALAVCTLGGENMAQRFENLEGESSHRFYLQYFFPPFSVGEVGRVGPPGRREVGHGKLAERALQAVIPSKESFPYTIRLESNITESNGSSSMASVCGGCMALMDAGVPVKRPVAGIAMGLVLENDRYTILSDILGIEDALGDMDFKITGDREGITAFQMDIKVEGITHVIMRDALEQARAGRIHILEKMLEVCPTHRSEMSIYAPRIETVRIKPSKIATVIGPGGKQIRAIIEATGVEIDIDDDGVVSIASSSLKNIEQAKAMIFGLTAEVEIGTVYTGKINTITDFGLFVEILPGKEGLCHISEYDVIRISDLKEYVKVGDQITVKVLDINERGQLKLSRKATLAGNSAPPAQSHAARPRPQHGG